MKQVQSRVWASWLTALCLLQPALAFSEAHVRNNTFNSTTEVTPLQMSTYNLNQSWADAVSVALQFEQSNWATGSVHTDPTYAVSEICSSAAPGSVLNVQEHLDTSTYSIPPQLAMSRFTYQTENYNGTAIPASAFVLWPYEPRSFNMTGDKVPLIVWAHGTIGWSPECAPSHMRNLDYNWAVLYQLALQGYAVVAPDYAGLGVGRDAAGNHILNQYLAHPAAAKDMLYSVQAAQQQWSMLSQQFVVVGHSQGGGVAWGTAQRQATNPIEGYLGTVAMSPVNDILLEGKYQPKPNMRIATTAIAMNSIFPDFEMSDWLEERGLQSIGLLQELQGCNPVAGELLGGSDTIKKDWNETWYAQQFSELMSTGGRPYAGPMLVIQGTDDGNAPFAATNISVNSTCELYPDNDLEYIVYEGAIHTPTVYASQRIWLDWIRERFEGVSVASGCQRTTKTPLRPIRDYQQNPTWYLEYALYSYEM